LIDVLRLVVVDVLVVLAAALALVLVLRFGRAVLDALPMKRARRVLLERVAPLAGVAVSLLFVAMATRWVLGTDDQRAWIALGAVAAVIVALSWGALRDVFEGVYLRAGRGCAVGDRVQLGSGGEAIRGRVQKLGLRGLHLEGEGGELAIVPYRALAGRALLRSPGIDHAAFRVFRIPLPPGRSLADARQAIVESALLHHWASVARQPQIVVTEDGQLEVTVFAVDPGRVIDVERALRAAVERDG
jgi:small-conductance mechanosensitive channel